MEIKAAEVAKLRQMTGAGMMDCKKALVEAEGPVYYTPNSEECLNGHREFIVEHKDLEITNIRHDNYYRQIAESYLKEVYAFIKQCEIYIG